MTETKWTPGPWENQGEDAFADMPFIRIGVGDRTICEVLPPVDAEEIDDETRANANLIVAAPDMYAATDWMNEIAEKGFMCSFLHIPVSDVKDHEKFEIILTGAEIRALINARRRAREGE